jgi:hypothetical protein
VSRLVLVVIFCTSAAISTSAVAAQESVSKIYGTREPRTCASRVEPSSGAPSVEQAKQYFLCDGEVVASDGFHLFTGVKIQVGAGRRFNPDVDSILDGVDPAQMIYPIRGTYTDYTCFPPHDATFLGGGIGKNCHKAIYIDTIGACYRTSFGDWRCGYMHGGRQEVDPGWPLPMYAPPSDG